MGNEGEGNTLRNVVGHAAQRYPRGTPEAGHTLFNADEKYGDEWEDKLVPLLPTSSSPGQSLPTVKKEKSKVAIYAAHDQKAQNDPRWTRKMGRGDLTKYN